MTSERLLELSLVLLCCCGLPAVNEVGFLIADTTEVVIEQEGAILKREAMDRCVRR